jgi:hypothetical protein
MAIILSISCPLLSYDKLSRKPMLFKSFTGLTVKEFDDIYDKDMAKDTAGMRSGGYPIEKTAGNDPRVHQAGISNWMLKTGFWCCLHITAFT